MVPYLDARHPPPGSASMLRRPRAGACRRPPVAGAGRRRSRWLAAAGLRAVTVTVTLLVSTAAAGTPVASYSATAASPFAVGPAHRSTPLHRVDAGVSVIGWGTPWSRAVAATASPVPDTDEPYAGEDSADGPGDAGPEVEAVAPGSTDVTGEPIPGIDVPPAGPDVAGAVGPESGGTEPDDHGDADPGPITGGADPGDAGAGPITGGVDPGGAGFPAAPSGAGEAAPGARYAWPLLPVPAVLTPFRAPAHTYGPGHRGVDLAGTTGQPVLAARAGTVVFAGMVAGRPVVSVQHDDGLRTTYEPVAPVVAAGEVVTAGAVLGVLEPGHPGCAGACLHWGVRRDRTDYLDPLVLLRPPRVRLLPVPDPWPT